MRVAIAGAGGRLGLLIFGMLQRLAQEENLTGVKMPIGLVGTTDGARALSKGLYRQFGMAFAPETAVGFVAAADPNSWQSAFARCNVAIIGGSYCIEKKRLPPSFMRSLSRIALHEYEFSLDGVGERAPSAGEVDSSTVLAAQLAGAAAAGVEKVIVACPSASDEWLDALAAAVPVGTGGPGCCVNLVTTPTALADTTGWTYLDMTAEALLCATPTAVGNDDSADDGQAPTATEEFARLLVSLAVSQEAESPQQVGRAGLPSSAGPQRAIARRRRAREPQLSSVPAARQLSSVPAAALPSTAVSLLSRRRLLSAAVGGGAAVVTSSWPACAAGSAGGGIRFVADDLTFGFELPPKWVPSTAADQERASSGHLIAVRAQRTDGAASVQAIVDGGSRGRRYGSSLGDLGPLEVVAQRLLQEELLNDDSAKYASVVSSERTGGLGGTAYYVVRYELGGRPAIAKLAVVQQRLYCVKVRATEEKPAGFFDVPEASSSLRADMEAVIESFNVVAVNSPCLSKSNAGSVPDEGVCKALRP